MMHLPIQNINQNSNYPDLTDPASGRKLVFTRAGDQVYFRDLENENTYPIVNGIPRLLEHSNNYAAAFGEQWLLWRQTQLDSFTSTTISRDRILRCLGEELIQRIVTSHKPVHVLEVGCGAGRFTEILLKFPAVRLTSVDLSSAVDANALNFPQNDRHRIIQMDIMYPPFNPRQYDLVICLGVIQHTPNPEATITKLYDQVKPGGDLVIDHYTFEIKRLTKFAANLLRPFIKRLPSKWRMHAVKYLVNIFFPIHKAIRKTPLAQAIFSRVSPINTYFHAYPQLSETLQKEWAILDTHDGLTDWYKHLRSFDQINTLLKEIGVTKIHITKGGNGIEARGQRPLLF